MSIEVFISYCNSDLDDMRQMLINLQSEGIGDFLVDVHVNEWFHDVCVRVLQDVSTPVVLVVGAGAAFMRQPPFSSRLPKSHDTCGPQFQYAGKIADECVTVINWIYFVNSNQEDLEPRNVRVFDRTTCKSNFVDLEPCYDHWGATGTIPFRVDLNLNNHTNEDRCAPVNHELEFLDVPEFCDYMKRGKSFVSMSGVSTTYFSRASSVNAAPLLSTHELLATWTESRKQKAKADAVAYLNRLRKFEWRAERLTPWELALNLERGCAEESTTATPMDGKKHFEPQPILYKMERCVREQSYSDRINAGEQFSDVEHFATLSSASWVRSINLVDGSNAMLEIPGNDIPFGRFGLFSTADRQEIVGLRSIRNLLRDYIHHPKCNGPLSIAVFGPPGSGKSSQVQQLARGLAKHKVRDFTFNLSQCRNCQEISRLLSQVRDAAIDDKLPCVFFDEFDSPHGTQPLGWLKLFLDLMEDGLFADQVNMLGTGKVIFVFAGGIASTYVDFMNQNDFWTRKYGLPGLFEAASVAEFDGRLDCVLDFSGSNRVFVTRRQEGFQCDTQGIPDESIALPLKNWNENQRHQIRRALRRTTLDLSSEEVRVAKWIEESITFNRPINVKSGASVLNLTFSEFYILVGRVFDTLHEELSKELTQVEIDEGLDCDFDTGVRGIRNVDADTESARTTKSEGERRSQRNRDTDW